MDDSEIKSRRAPLSSGDNVIELTPPGRTIIPETAIIPEAAIEAMAHLPELPSDLQLAFEIAKAKAELVYATRAQRFPNHPQFADGTLQLPILIQDVFFEYCAKARNAGRRRDWPLTRVRQASDAAFPIICEFYVGRERREWPEEARLKYRNAAWQVISDEARWQEHLLEIAALGEAQQAYSSAEQTTPANEKLDDSHLPDLTPGAAERIADVLKDARSHLSGNANETHLTQAMALYLDSLAWEYVLTQSSTAFEALVNPIVSKARNEFPGDAVLAEDRKRYWITEAQERAANRIIGLVMPIRVVADQVQIFHDLELQFRAMPGARGDLQVIFFDETRFNIFSDYPDPVDDILERQKFELLARQAMAALDFRFADSSRAIFYWLQFLKQKSPHFKQWKSYHLCAASADFCAELKTRARESAPRGTGGENVGVGALPLTTGKEAQVHSWEEVEIRFLSDERVQITAGKYTESRNYAEFGFEDGRSKTPNRAWCTLRFLAESDGVILQAPHGHDWTGIEKRIQEIRKRFRVHFRLDEDPILFAGGYRAQFKISCAPSYKS